MIDECECVTDVCALSVVCCLLCVSSLWDMVKGKTEIISKVKDTAAALEKFSFTTEFKLTELHEKKESKKRVEKKAEIEVVDLKAEQKEIAALQAKKTEQPEEVQFTRQLEGSDEDEDDSDNYVTSVRRSSQS